MLHSNSIIISNVKNILQFVKFLNIRLVQNTLNMSMLRNLPIYVYDKNYRTNMLVYRNQFNKYSMRRTNNKLDHRCRITFQQFVRTYTLTNKQFIDILLLNENKMNIFRSNVNSIIHTLEKKGYVKKITIDHEMSALLDELD